MNTNTPPKNREFLGLVFFQGNVYWGIFHWYTCNIPKYDGYGYVDSELNTMPPIVGWVELPEIPIVDCLDFIK